MNYLLIIFSSLLTVAVAQQPFLSCNYFAYGDVYGCQLTINNPNGFNNFTEIGGIHLEGFTNADLTQLYKSEGFSPNVPSIICQTFPNVQNFELYSTELTEIGDSDFDGCSRITQLTLSGNRITSVSTNAFANLPEIEYIDLGSNSLRTLPENVFANKANLWILDLNNNPFDEIPETLFRPLENLEFLYIGNANLNAINSQWFLTNARLSYLYLGGNRIEVLDDSFAGLEGLTALNLGDNALSEIPVGAFARLPNLYNLYLNGNNFRELQADSFATLEHLDYLDLSENPIEIIHDGAFRGLTRLVQISVSACGLRQLDANSFEGLENLYYLYLNFNEIEDIPNDVFAPLTQIRAINLWGNRLKTLNRNSFGDLSTLSALDLDFNIVNALDRAIIDDAVNLGVLYFNGNLCASNYFGNFELSRATYLPMLERCFSNMRYVVVTTTEGDGAFSFFDGPHPGIALRVNTDNEVQIALTPFNFVWSPVIEILIGTSNNTRSVIRMNQEIDVVTVPTPNIIRQDQWNDFRVTWSNQIILVYSGSNNFPFMAFTLRDFFPVNFYGLRAVETSASWSVQPFDW